MTLLSSPLCAAGTPVWTKTTFQNETAWSSTQGEVLAIVSEQRCRLLYLGAADGTLNLLSAPTPRVAPSAHNVSPNWGGHRFWLGPQRRWAWPPNTDWEFSQATSAHVEGSVLVLTQPQTDKSYPALTREYAWEGSRVRCTVRWKDDGRAYYGMHVVAIEAPAQIPVVLKRTSDRPLGIVRVDMNWCKTDGFLPNPAFQVTGENGTVVSGSVNRFKCGLSPQPLRVARAQGWELSVHPGPSEGIDIGASDTGYLTQIWVGTGDDSFSELEQLSPLLLGNDQGQCSSTCYIEAKR